MKHEEKIALLEEILEVEEGALSGEVHLSEVKQWDSLARISFISLIEERFDRIVGHEEIRECRIVNDLLRMME